ncbi:uncharacterized protein [Physcomitrium patens]|uniref:Heterokaryon incompatibility domain-containing protein n=1 Tax=Physcomitrium patens TaxID=3218 RepID=A0A2K1IVV0_PHYPA|nr:uncharacterized protein LOC112273272 [Physcomitrium patens]XP_024357584.1 uncharacterized protein LOC112273272 [Physcomitrium patens]XP_024357585.1 uncharacterized protein LOC112273272 [Physcomitrium patens]XP_024357586.1 uncharacterized protein LOC112273272 [Physcomitrium patens]XP_024357588.1 uncharacterized protein LOC112273272 [Physcomitrium patens]XP_024357589.1 uncharacterized protein LOC112273272 [Physcomitrium patens]XP_024357590.1 uncharacterized protein LOC112273272 [Physcomitriu|eukprot:XP_024357583.1 uncharacterized protein LOC112273272 [Physcomitrella patens]
MAMFLDENSAPVLADSALCKICNTLDLDQIFSKGVREPHSITLGALATILSKKRSCGLCGLISHLISRSWLLDRHTSEDLTSVRVQLLAGPCGWADSSQVVPRPLTACAHRIQVRAMRPIAIHRTVMKEKVSLTMELQMMEDDAARFGRERAYHGRRVGAVVNFKLIKEWMAICEKEHGPTCANVWENVTEQLPQGARMIDVAQMAVVEAPQNCRYVALSYMWGIIDTNYKTVLKNVDQRRHRGSLESVALPRTIHDAIKVVRELEERYLWVDAMCIVQDDPVNTKAQIAGMATIYGAAILTIFSVGGDSADAPLPGLGPGSRQVLQRIERIQSLSLAVPLRMLIETLAASKWNTRGWTFQEHVLSRRGLFFTNEQLFFECQRDVFFEDVIVESSKDTAMYPGKSHGLGYSALHSIRNKKDQQSRYQAYAKAFMQILEEYTQRQLTNVADIYNAIFAIITVFSRDIEITPLDPNTAFLFGVPLSVLEDAMLWQPALNAPSHNRRREKGLVTPSWSWAGWEISVVYFDLFGFMYGPPGALRSLVDELVIIDPDGEARRIAIGRHLWEHCGPVEIDKYRRPSSPSDSLLVEEGANLAPGTLLFYTTVALLRVQKVNNQLDEITGEDQSQVPVYGSKFHSVFEILSETLPPAKMGRIVLPTDTDTMVPLEFAVLSRSNMGCGPETYDEQVFGIRHEGCLLNVMVVTLLGYTVYRKEVSERVGIGVIVEKGWIAARFWERVVRLQ